MKQTLVSFILVTNLAAQQPADRLPILNYIKQTWSTLTRSDKDLAKAAVDPKFKPGPDGKWPLYISRSEDAQLVEEGLRRDMPAAGFATISIKQLPEDMDALPQQGLLYLPKPYVVPGGRFNEMYGWDSYFIQVGLLKDNEIDLAKDMADNFLYQVKYYGKVLNANRTYYLNRSQPPFLTQMVQGVYAKTHDKKWLADALPLIEKYYQLWATEPHLTPGTALARYWDFGEGPAPEVLSAEKDAQGRTHYDLVRDYYRTHAVADYGLDQYYDKTTDQLTMLFYKGDRSMRESGFDPSNRFGAFNIDIIHYNPVCLNSLLYLMEMQTAEILTDLGRPGEAGAWQAKAQARARAVNQLMWDEEDGLYYDYNFIDRKVRRYPFLTTFYPLWAGFADKEQAARIVKNLPVFEKIGGLQTSTHLTGNQWDSPFGWAPLEMIAVEGLRRYGYNADAERIAMKFLSLVKREYERTGVIVEKYDVVHGGTAVNAIHFGYSANQVGFGWTNAAFLELLDGLTKEDRKKLLAESIHGRE
jgi:alpha,alpha-trehalase